VPLPFNLSASKRQKTEDGNQFVPLKVQVEQVFHQLREDEGFEVAHSGKQSQPKLTVPCDPTLLSSERSKLYEEVVSTEDKILAEIHNRRPFKARPLNRKLFERRDSTNERTQ